MRTLTLSLALVLSLLLAGCLGPDIFRPPLESRVGHDLQSAWEQSCKNEEAHCRTHTDDGCLVSIDGLAYEDARRLAAQFRSAGLREVTVAVPIASARLPVCDLPQLETCCDELRRANLNRPSLR